MLGNDLLATLPTFLSILCATSSPTCLRAPEDRPRGHPQGDLPQRLSKRAGWYFRVYALVCVFPQEGWGYHTRGGGGGGRDSAWRNRHLGLTHTETQRGRLWTACGQRRVDSKNSQTTQATTSTSSIRQLLGAADAQTAHHATFSPAPTHQLLASANAETTPARAPAAAADRKQQPDATCEGKNG